MLPPGEKGAEHEDNRSVGNLINTKHTISLFETIMAER
jgi:hypothetical protein